MGMRLVTAILAAGLAVSFGFSGGHSSCLAEGTAGVAARDSARTEPRAAHVASIKCIDPDTGDRFAPLGVAFGLAGDLYVVDGDNSSVFVISGESGEPAFFAACPGSSDCQFVDIVSDAGAFYVSDRAQGTVTVIDSNGRVVAERQVGSGVGGIGLGVAGQVYAAMTLEGSVVIADLYGDNSPVVCPVFDSTDGSYPVDCLLGKSNGVLVSDALSRKVLVLSVLGKRLGSLVGFEFKSPFGLARLDDRWLLVSDSELGLVAVFDSDGKFAGTIGQGSLETPTFMDMRDDGTLAVADAGTMTIEVFRFGDPASK